MDLVFNELSFIEHCSNSEEAKNKFIYMLETYRTAKEKYNFSHIRFPSDLSKFKVTSEFTFYEWVQSISHQGDKNIILSQIRRPFSDSLEEKEIKEYCESDFSLVSEDSPTSTKPEGLAIAYILNVPSISLSNHDFWLNRKIQILKSSSAVDVGACIDVYNICLHEDIESEEIKKWAEQSLPEMINSYESLIKYLHYVKYEINFENKFMEEILEWKKTDFDLYKRILRLMKDVELHPFSGGMGKTENLSNSGKECSKRITELDRLSYSLENNVVTFYSCKGHYNFR